MTIGVHIAKHPSYGDQAARFEQYGCNTVQIFVKQPSATTDVNLQYDSILERVKKGRTRVYVHANYLTHMCKAGIATKMLMDQIRICSMHRFHALIVHLENKPGTENIAAAIHVMKMREMVVGHRPLIIFEIIGLVDIDDLPPGESRSFERPEKLRFFIDGVAAAGYTQHDFGVCIDTAHLWTMSYNCSYTASINSWLHGLGDASWIKLFHLNDNKNPLGGRDQHEHIGFGRIWPITFGERHKQGEPYPYDGLRRLPHTTEEREPGFIGVLRYAKKHGIDCMLERSSGDDAHTVDELCGLIRLYKEL